MATTRAVRQEARNIALAQVQIRWKDEEGRERLANVRCLNVSHSGMQVQLPDALPVRSFVNLQCRELGLHGTASVRYCRREGPRYGIGLEFAGELKWRG